VCPFTFVIVSAHCDDRRDSVEGVEDLLVSDVARVEYHFDARKGLNCLWTHQPVGIGDDSD
jgi:hypothetical protein